MSATPEMSQQTQSLLFQEGGGVDAEQGAARLCPTAKICRIRFVAHCDDEVLVDAFARKLAPPPPPPKP